MDSNQTRVRATDSPGIWTQGVIAVVFHSLKVASYTWCSIIFQFSAEANIDNSPGIWTQGVQAVAFRSSQGRISQTWRSILFPSQSEPSCLGDGLVQVRRRSLQPADAPHPAPPALVHCVQGPQADHPPSTGARAGSEISRNSISIVIYCMYLSKLEN